MIHSSPTFRRMAKIRKRFASGWTLLIPLVVTNGRYLLASFSRKTICDCRCTCVTCKTSFAPFARIFTFTDSGYIRLDENRAIADTWKFARRVPHSLLFFFSVSLASAMLSIPLPFPGSVCTASINIYNETRSSDCTPLPIWPESLANAPMILGRLPVIFTKRGHWASIRMRDVAFMAPMCFMELLMRSRLLPTRLGTPSIRGI